MAETYCGKTCEDCTYRQQLNCPGCRMGPGRALHGDCSISKCSVKKGYHGCEYCSSFDTCRNRLSSRSAPEERLRKIQAEFVNRKHKEENVKLLGFWMWILFWLVIVSCVVRLVLNDSMIGEYPFLKRGMVIFNFISNVGYCLVLLRLLAVSDHYRYSAIAGLVGAFVSFIAAFSANPTVALVVTLASAVIAFVREFQEYMGHADAAQDVDNELSEKWGKLWYWYFGSTCLSCLGAVLAMFGSGLGVLAVLLGTLTTAVVSVIKIVLLYKAATLFKNYSEEML